MGWDAKNLILDAIFKEHFGDEEAFCRELYLNWDELQEMIEGGMTIGSHSHSHPDLSELDEAKQSNEITLSKQLLEKYLNCSITQFCYPYGAYNAVTLKLLCEAGYTCALNTIFEVNSGKVNPYEIKRLDTNHLPQPLE